MLAIKSELKFVKFLKKINKKKLFILTGSQSYIASGMYLIIDIPSFLYILAVPAVITGLSLGITRTEGYGNDRL